MCNHAFMSEQKKIRTEIDIARDKVREAINSGRWGKRALAREAQISNGSLRLINEPDWNPQSDVLDALLRVLARTSGRRPLGNGANQTRLSA